MADKDDRPHTIPLYDFRVGDLRAWHLVEAVCFRCRHVAMVSHGILKHGRSENEWIKYLGARLKCTKCGNRQGNRISLRALPRNT